MSAPTPLPCFDEIYREFLEPVRRRVSRYVPADEVEDLTQEVFTKIAQQLPGFEGRSSLKTWIHRIATNCALDRVRSRAHRERRKTDSMDHEACASGACTCQPEETAPAAPAQVHELIASEMCACIREQVTELAPDYQEVLWLRDEENLTNQEIADQLGISLAAAKIRLHRARQALRTQMDGSCDYYRTAENEIACDRKPAKPADPSPSSGSSRSPTRPEG